MTKRLIYSFAAFCLAAACLHAGQQMTASIPFQFHVGRSVFPAGSYTTETALGTGNVVMLRSRDGKSSVMVLSNSAVQSRGRHMIPSLIFHRYGDQYFLFQVWTGPDSGREFVPSRQEAELAAAAKRAMRTVVATR